MTSSSRGPKTYIIQILFAAVGLCQIALCQTSLPVNSKEVQSPSYEVATIKPAKGGEQFHLVFRDYISAAFGINPNSSRQLIGPTWIDKISYDIHGKPPESVQAAMSEMPPDEKSAETRSMMRSLLVDRFNLKYHVEMREMKVYKLILAKGGSKLKEDSDRTKSRAMLGNGSIKGKALTIPVFLGLLTGNPDVDSLPIIDETGLTGTYDFSLVWSPLRAANGINDAATSPNADQPSLIRALNEQLGLKLVVSKGRAKVVVIDHIEPPSPN